MYSSTTRRQSADAELPFFGEKKRKNEKNKNEEIFGANNNFPLDSSINRAIEKSLQRCYCIILLNLISLIRLRDKEMKVNLTTRVSFSMTFNS